MKKKLIPKIIIEYADLAGKFLVRYRFVIGVVAVGALFALTFWKINVYSNVDKDENKVTDGLSAIKKVKFDNVAVDKIKALNDQNVTVSPNLPRSAPTTD